MKYVTNESPLPVAQNFWILKVKVETVESSCTRMTLTLMLTFVDPYKRLASNFGSITPK